MAINPSIDPKPNLGSGALVNQKIIPASIVSKTRIGINPDRIILFINNKAAKKESIKRTMIVLSAIDRFCHHLSQAERDKDMQ